MTTDSDQLGLSGRVVLVTGAGRGLGRAYAMLLAHHGAKVVVHDAGVDEDGRDPDPVCAAKVAEAIRSEGGESLAVTELLGDAASCRRVVQDALDRFGRIDALIHNAGLVIWRDPAEVDQSVYARLTGVNTEAPFWLCSQVLPLMRAQGFGRIVLSTSGWALYPNSGSDRLVLYTHGKGAQFGLAMGLAEGAGHPDVKTNLIAPIANTRMFKGEVPADRLRPELVAGAVVWLASPACPLSGCLVKAADGELALARIVTGESANLAEDAADPEAAGRALMNLAAVEGTGT